MNRTRWTTTLALVLIYLVLWSFSTSAQTPNPVTPGYQVCNTNDPGNTRCSWQPVDATHGLPITGGGGGGGLSVVDQTVFTQGTSAFTPSGGVFNDTATLSAGQSGMFRLTTKRAQIVDVDSTGNQLHTDLTSSIPTGSNIIGRVGIDQTTPGTTNLVALGANQSVNVAQFGGVSTSTGQVAVSVAPVTATNTALVAALRPDSPGIITLGPAAVSGSVPFTFSSQYPTNATTTTPAAITGNATGSTGAVVGTLAGVASKTTFVCGFNVSAIGGVATVGPVTVAGLVGSSQVYQVPVNATAGQVLLTQNFNPCIPASAANTAITITTTADGTATAVDVNSWGYQL